MSAGAERRARRQDAGLVENPHRLQSAFLIHLIYFTLLCVDVKSDIFHLKHVCCN